MQIYLTNAFSANMLPTVKSGGWAGLTMERISVDLARRLVAKATARGVKLLSFIRHPAAAKLAEHVLGLQEAPEQVPVAPLNEGDVVLVVVPAWKDGRPPETREFTAEELQALAVEVDIYAIVVLRVVTGQDPDVMKEP